MTDSPFGNPDGPEADAIASHDPVDHRPLASGLLSVQDVLAAARLPERTATICVRPDLQAEHDAIAAEMATLVSADGELLVEDDEASMGAQTNAARARELADRDRQVLDEMRANLWHVRLRAMDADEWPEFKKTMPKGKDADVSTFRAKLIARCAIEPPITVEDVAALRKKFGSAQINKISNRAYEACEQDGVDVPKSPGSWANLLEQ